MLHRLELSGDADSENNHGGSSRTYILHRTGRTQEDDQLLREGREWADPTGRQGWIDPTRAGLLDEDSAPAVDRGDGSDDLQWLDLRSSASACHPIKVAHPLMLRAIAAAKKKNDQIDASKIADRLRCDFLPECHMMPATIGDRRRTLRYRQLLVRQMVQMKNRVSGTADGDRCGVQQATTAQGELFS